MPYPDELPPIECPNEVSMALQAMGHWRVLAQILERELSLPDTIQADRRDLVEAAIMSYRSKADRLEAHLAAHWAPT
ncbi:MAG: hypothetical protein H0X45_12415 [Planctomycetes bacterium]|nr:hypothetical protein [Planctomycetota bacterium]